MLKVSTTKHQEKEDFSQAEYMWSDIKAISKHKQQEASYHRNVQKTAKDALMKHRFLNKHMLVGVEAKIVERDVHKENQSPRRKKLHT